MTVHKQVHDPDQAPLTDTEQGIRSDVERPLDPGILQQRASDPLHSVWVSASAGTGKTKVLTDRLLRLLLPRADGSPGAPPGKILCLTYTKAAAGEMNIRLQERLAAWAVAEDALLRADLLALLGRAPSDEQHHAARRLFAQILDAPGGLRIQTIHAFCQSVLARFPLEAGLLPGFELIEERAAQNFLTRALRQTMTDAQNPATPLQGALNSLAAWLSEAQLNSLVQAIAGERHQFKALMTSHFGPQGAYTELCQTLNVRAGWDKDAHLRAACDDDALNIPLLRALCQALMDSGGKTERDNAAAMAPFLAADKLQRPILFDHYASAFLTAKNTIKSARSLMSAALIKRRGDLYEAMQVEAARLQAVRHQIQTQEAANISRDLMIFAEAVLQTYTALKQANGVLDYDDLIFHTQSLLEGRAQWVLYKLDQGLDHILLDEAQDTNPEQWKIIQSLYHEFFAGTGARAIQRTVFVVGDEKQSIFSFQRADPKTYTSVRHDLENKTTEAGQPFRAVPMDISFRTVPSVLQAVDAVFAPPDMRPGMGARAVQHRSFRRTQGGEVVLWPLLETEKEPENDPWTPPVQVRETQSGAAKLAQHIAQTVKGWLKQGEILASHGRAITPGDIMILVKSRNALMLQVSRALKNADIPVSGLDRMVLSQQIAVQDLLAAAAFALHPADDLALASLLKSPLLGMDEDTLFHLCYDRAGTLWESLQKQGSPTLSDWLSDLIVQGRGQGPYAFFSLILERPCPADAQSGLHGFQRRLGRDTADPLAEFLNLALVYERSHGPYLQYFIHWQAQSETVIKRELEDQGGQVRIMTVHGAKGLQAPIVILPDTLRVQRRPGQRASNHLHWPAQTRLPCPLYTGGHQNSFPLLDELKTHQQQRDDEEYRRLLYVAMTRAEDRLYIGGAQGRKPAIPESWYFMVRAGLQSLSQIQAQKDGALQFSGAQTGLPKPDKHTDKKEYYCEEPTDLSFLLHPPPPETLAAPALSPSRLAALREGIVEPPAPSPLSGQPEQRFRRGIVTHRLLELLPAYTGEQHARLAQIYLAQYALDLSEPVRCEIAREVLAIIQDKTFAPLFTPEARAEVPITGHIGGQLINGKIDRLMITDDEILILDYKTNRPPPKNPENVPPAYRAQMQAYKALLQGLYPGHIVRCALLWTDGPVLMALDNL